MPGEPKRGSHQSKRGGHQLRLGVVVGSSGRARPLPSKPPVLTGPCSALSLELPWLLLQQVRLALEEIQVKRCSFLHGAGYCSGQWRGTSPVSYPPPFLEGRKMYQQHQGRTLSQQRHLGINLLINLVGVRQGTQRSWSLRGVEHRRVRGLFWVLQMLLPTGVAALSGAPRPVGQRNLCLLLDSTLGAVLLRGREGSSGAGHFLLWTGGAWGCFFSKC